MIFGASKDVSGLSESAREMEMQALMQRAWAVFADDPVRGLEREWDGLSMALFVSCQIKQIFNLNAIC
jgi:hypothetical protein